MNLVRQALSRTQALYPDFIPDFVIYEILWTVLTCGMAVMEARMTRTKRDVSVGIPSSSHGHEIMSDFTSPGPLGTKQRALRLLFHRLAVGFRPMGTYFQNLKRPNNLLCICMTNHEKNSFHRSVAAKRTTKFFGLGVFWSISSKEMLPESLCQPRMAWKRWPVPRTDAEIPPTNWKKKYKPKKPSAQPLHNCRCLLTRLTHAGFCAERESNIVSASFWGEDTQNSLTMRCVCAYWVNQIKALPLKKLQTKVQGTHRTV